MSYYSNLRTLAACQDRHDNMCPPDSDEPLPGGCKEEDYDDWDESDGYDGCLTDRVEGGK